MANHCLKCGEPLEAGMEKCPKCGSRDKLVTINDSITTHEMLEARQRAEGCKDYKKLIRSGEKIGKKTGRLARERFVIDRENKRKYHLVEEQNEQGEWEIVHKEDEPLD